MEQRPAVFLLGEGESKSLQMTAEGNDAGVTRVKSRNGRGGINVLLQNDDIRNRNITSKYICVTKT